MKRILTTIALVAGLLLIAAPAQAECDDACTIAALQDQVLTLTVENATLRSENAQLKTNVAILQGAVVDMRNQRDMAQDAAARSQADFNALAPKVSKFYNLVMTLRAVVKDLRQTIRTLT